MDNDFFIDSLQAYSTLNLGMPFAHFNLNLTSEDQELFNQLKTNLVFGGYNTYFNDYNHSDIDNYEFALMQNINDMGNNTLIAPYAASLIANIIKEITPPDKVAYTNIHAYNKHITHTDWNWHLDSENILIKEPDNEQYRIVFTLKGPSTAFILPTKEKDIELHDLYYKYIAESISSHRFDYMPTYHKFKDAINLEKIYIARPGEGTIMKVGVHNATFHSQPISIGAARLFFSVDFYTQEALILS